MSDLRKPASRLELSAKFKEKINSVFPNGQEWLDRLPQLFGRCVELWGLTDWEFPSTLYYNFICFAQSAQHGQVVLKMGVPREDWYVEMNSMAYFDGQYMCRCHATSHELGAALLERITPGYDLSTVKGAPERARIAAELIRRMPAPVPPDASFPTYAKWLDVAFEKVRKARPAHSALLQLADKAATLFRSLPGDTAAQRLLHGDLHHFNILYDERHNAWRAIDPHGVIGHSCLEAGRFVQNQLGMENDEESQKQALLQMTGILGHALQQPPRMILLSTFIDIVLSTCWTTEDVAPDEEEIEKGIDIARLVLGYLE
jgi:streptomycin 6-kinase